VRAVSISRTARAVLSGICWTAAVVVGVLTTSGFVSNGVSCVQGQTICAEPNILWLLGGVAGAVALGIIGAVVWKPRPRRRARRPWEYLD
jgi:hypothetical protein